MVTPDQRGAFSAMMRAMGFELQVRWARCRWKPRPGRDDYDLVWVHRDRDGA